MSPSRPRFMGKEVHQDAIAVASVAPEHGAAVTYLGAIGTRQGDREQMIRKMPSTANPLIFVYDAGSGGSWLARYCMNKGDDCGGAPSLLPQTPGARVTTDHWDAGPRARLARSGDLPTGEDAALCALTRAREEARSDRQDANGSRRWSVPPRRRPASVKPMSVQCMSRPNDSSISNRHDRRTGKPGVCTRGSRRFQPGAVCNAPGPCPWAQKWASARVWSSHEP